MKQPDVVKRGGSKDKPWARRVVAVSFGMHGWDGGVDTVLGHDAVKDPRASIGGRTRRLTWDARP